MSNIIQKLEELSVTLVMAESTDLQAFGELYKRFDELSGLAQNESQHLVEKASAAISGFIEKIIMGEVADKDEALDIISRAVSAIQNIIANGRSTGEITFPEELGLSETDTSAESAESQQETSETMAEESSDIEADVLDMESPIADPELAADFISEAREHLDDADSQLLTLEGDPKNEDALGAVYRAFHTIKGVAGFLSLEDISGLAHETESLLDQARKGNLTLTGPASDVTFESVDALRQMLDDVEEALSSGKLKSRKKLISEILSRIQVATSGDSESPVTEEVSVNTPEASEQTPTETIYVGIESEEASKPEAVEEDYQETAPVIGSSPQEEADEEEPEQEKEESQKADAKVNEEDKALPDPVPQAEKTVKSTSATARVKETLKIEAERLDKLVDTIGELVIAESMVSQDIEIVESASPRVSRNLSRLSKITRELQEIGMSLRLMPVRPVFERMARLARDVSRKSNKKVNFTTSGEDTEVDKSIVEKISDPLTHMIRNAVDHGLESSSDERLKAGKPEVGSVQLRAFHKGGNIHIEVEDDGKGLNREAILIKARERGVITNRQSMSDQEVFKLIMAPGFSTAKKVTDVSGRGVGMDVVSRNVQALRGQVDISSTPGRGTFFSIRLPLTLAIIDGIIVRVGTERYIVPTLSVLESVRPTKEEIPTVLNQGEMISVRGKLLPLFRISNLFSLYDAEEDPTKALVIIVEDEGKQTGLLVDDLVGHQQIVIKNLGSSSRSITGISGGAIMADGQVGLILDVAGIIKMAAGTADMLAM